MKKTLAFLQCWLGTGFALIALFGFIIYTTHNFFLSNTVVYSVCAALAGAALIAALLLSGFGKAALRARAGYIVQSIIRYFLAYQFVFYALGKLFNLQFAVPPEVLSQKAGELEGFWKAWLFYGHSYHYGVFIAVTEIAVALLLLFRRTQTTAAVVYVFMMANITYMDFAFGVEAMQWPALLITLMALWLLWYDGQRVWRFAGGRSAAAMQAQPFTPRVNRWLGMAAFAVLAAGVVSDILFFKAALAKM
jgi:hypothetical protein